MSTPNPHGGGRQRPEARQRPELPGERGCSVPPTRMTRSTKRRFRLAWTQGNGVLPAIPLDVALDNISLYWFTNSGASSARFYWEVFRTGFGGYSAGRIELPMAATIFPGEFYQAPRTWAEQAWPNLFYWNQVDRGGHFAAWSALHT